MFRLNDEHWLSNLQGTTYTKQLEDAVHAKARRLTFDYLVENDLREARLHETVVTSILDAKSRILGIDINQPNDLILDNFGKWLASFIQARSDSDRTVALTDDGNSSRTVTIYKDTGQFNNVGYETLGTHVRVGSGSTAAARGNYSVETPFGTAPESAVFDTNTGSYAVGYISCSGAITAGGSGTVNETGFYGFWVYSGGGGEADFMLFHDILESGVAFVAGNTINVSYSISI